MPAFRRLGLQRRIMAYVTVGLAAMFGVGAFVGSAAIDQASALVFTERLATAYTTAGIVERDLARLASDSESALAGVGEVGGIGGIGAQEAAETLAERLGPEGRYPFFTVVGVCIAGQDGRVAAEAWAVPGAPAGADRCAEATIPGPRAGVVEAAWRVDGWTTFGDLLLPTSATGAGGPVVVRLAAASATGPFDPAVYGGRRPTPDPSGEPPTGGRYNLEILDRDGVARLAIGEHEHPGGPSPHYPAVAEAMEEGRATAIVDEGDPAIGLEPHVMAIVPLADTPFWLLLEQPSDVALALPNELRARLVILVVAGFLAAATVAWFTTRRVVLPTERLTAAADRMAKGDLTGPIQVSAQDEIADLAETLETMRLHLLAAREELERTNRALEQRVSERTARLGLVLRKVISAQEDERHGLARELHDETAQTLAALSISLDRARDSLGTGASPALDHIGAAKAIATRLLDDTRRLILGLRPSILDDMGLGAAIAWLSDEVLTPKGIAVTLDIRPGERLPAHLETSLFRIAQEAVNNVAKHSGASTARIQLRLEDGRATIVVEDDGAGFDVEEALTRAPGAGSVGLVGMQERVALLGGRIELEGRPQQGSRVTVSVPVGPEEVA